MRGPRYVVNKLRAAQFARRKGTEVVYAVAKDVPIAAATRECPTIVAKKREWLPLICWNR